jgi:hypothetical protein
MKKISIIIICLLSLASLKAQYFSEHEFVSNEAAVDSLLKLHKIFNSNYKSISGYRIQIFKGSGNSSLENARIFRDEFSEDHENIPTYISFQEPYYRLRIGDFRDRLDAINFLRKIKNDYPSAFVIQDEIEFVILPKYQKSISYEQEDSSRD